MNHCPPHVAPAVLSGAVTALLVACALADRVAAADPANAAPDVAYTGTESCIECHQDQYQTYLETAHSRSMEKIDPEEETAPASLQHKLSGRDYEVLRRDDQLIHREVIRGVDGAELATTEHPIAYAIGSGVFGKSYVYRSGDVLGQSPLSWYEDAQKWDMSPGYDVPFHPGFGRKLTEDCFFCHVGNLEQKGGNPHDFSILEHSIGCERCHGPGELHVAKQRREPDASGPDDSIVHPGRLPRELSEAVCQQCHLQAVAKVLRAGKEEWDFRPGLPLTDYRLDYQFALEEETMRVVGHVEQLHMSECYRQTETLTCITCHNPHHTPTPESAAAHYRSVCLDCHQDDSCGKPHAERVELAANDCAECHMPKRDTEVPHTAFRHHRIGIHPATDQAEAVAGVAPVLDISELTADELARCDALAKVQVAQSHPGDPRVQDYGTEAAAALIQLKNAGKLDVDANTVLAMLAHDQAQPAIAQDLASEVAASERTASRAKIESLRLLAQLAFQRQDFEEAVEHYRELTTYQQEPRDLFHLGMAEQNIGNSDKAIEALRTVIELQPTFADAHRGLSAIYQSSGRREDASRHADLAEQHERRMQRLWQQAEQ